MTEPVGSKGITADPLRKVIAKIGDPKQANTGAVPRSPYERIMRCMQPTYSRLPGRPEADVGLDLSGQPVDHRSDGGRKVAAGWLAAERSEAPGSPFPGRHPAAGR